jgi:hypothetical protein
MFSGERIFPVAALVMLVVVVAVIVNVVSTVSSQGEKDPFDKDEVAEYLADVEDAEAGFTVMIASGFVLDSFLGPLLGVLLYILFRGRNGILALAALAFFLVQSAVSLVADSLAVGLLLIAKDFVAGGAGGIAAGDPATLELGRALAMLQPVTVQAGWSALAAGFLALGLLISFTPERGVVPPRWIGWLFLLAGVAGVLSWLVVVAEAGFVFFPIGGLAQLIGLVALAVWLLRSQGNEESMMTGAMAAA